MIQELKHYIYTYMGKELFTPNLDLAMKRADEDTQIKIIDVW